MRSYLRSRCIQLNLDERIWSLYIQFFFFFFLQPLAQRMRSTANHKSEDKQGSAIRNKKTPEENL